MRFLRPVLIVSLVLWGVSGLQAQTAHRIASECCGCQQCQPCQESGQCGQCGQCDALLPCLTRGIRSALSGIIPGQPGCDARHKIYKAALQRSTFDKKCLLPIAYYSHILPCWSHNRCCCGPVSTNCPTCGPGATMGEEMIEMQPYPDDMPVGPTPAVEPETTPAPETPVAPKAAQFRSRRQATSRTRPVSTKHVEPRSRLDRVVTGSNTSTTLKSLAPLVPVTKPVSTQPMVRQVSAEVLPTRPQPVNPLR